MVGFSRKTESGFSMIMFLTRKELLSRFRILTFSFFYSSTDVTSAIFVGDFYHDHYNDVVPIP